MSDLPGSDALEFEPVCDVRRDALDECLGFGDLGPARDTLLLELVVLSHRSAAFPVRYLNGVIVNPMRGGAMLRNTGSIRGSTIVSLVVLLTISVNGVSSRCQWRVRFHWLQYSE